MTGDMDKHFLLPIYSMAACGISEFEDRGFYILEDHLEIRHGEVCRKVRKISFHRYVDTEIGSRRTISPDGH